MSNTISFPNTPFLQGDTKKIAPEWILWLTNPSFSSVTLAGTIPTISGGTGFSGTPGVGQLLVGTGSAFTLAVTLPTAAMPALTGDVTSAAGSTVTALSPTTATPGAFGSGTLVSTFTVDANGRLTASGTTAITGTVGAFTVATGFGCNGKTAQTSATANAAIAATAGAAYTGVEQTMLNDLKALVNQIRAALVADGVMI